MIVLLVCGTSLAKEPISKAPPNVQVALFVKLLATNKNITRTEEVSIHVMGNPKFASALKVAIGKSLGQAKLKAVTEGDLPTDKVDGLVAIYVGDRKQWEPIKAYCRQHQILSISGLPDLVDEGVTLTVGAHKKKPKVILDIKASKEEGMNWDPQILKIATLINK